MPERRARGTGRANGRPQTRIQGARYNNANITEITPYKMREDAPPAQPGRCTATARSTGVRCKANAIFGADVCRKHGGQVPDTIAAAYQRIRANADLASQVILDLMLGAEDERVRLAAARDLLDRAGVIKHVGVQVEVSKFESKVISIVRRARKERGIPEDIEEDIEDAEWYEEDE